MIIDTHSHLYGEEFATDISDVIDRARAAGLGKIFLPNINADSIKPMLALTRRSPGFFYPMIGLHPEDLGTTWREVLPKMEAMLQQPGHPFIAIGEVGLDYYWDRSLYEEQQEAFAIQVCWAQKYHLPLMIHTRDAHRELVNILKQQIVNCKFFKREASQGAERSNCTLSGVFHCFGGTAEEAEELLDFEGFMLGIGGVVTFKKSPLPEVLKATVPLERIVVETDSPYLAPVPYRGKRNESAYVVEVLRKLSQIYEKDIDEVASITTSNALKTFPKSQISPV